LKVLVLTQYFPPEIGAPQARLFELMLRLKAYGGHITILTAMPNYPQMQIYEGYENKQYMTENIEGLEVHRSNIYIPKSKKIIPRLRNYFSFVISSFRYGRNLGEFDYIFCESPPLFLGITAVLLKRHYTAKLIFNVSDLWPESAEKLEIVTNKFFLGMAYKLEAFLYKKSFLITGQTNGIVKDIKNRFPKSKVFWLPNGVDEEKFDPEIVESAGWRKKLNYQDDDFVFLYAGIHGHAQGLEIIIEAADRIKNTRAKFLFVGSGPEKRELIELTKRKGLDKVVKFHDSIEKDAISSLIKEIDAVIIPLKKLDLFKGAIPSKIFENLSMGKPVILGVDGEAREIFVENGQCALYFEPENIEHLIARINELMDIPETRNRLINNSRKFVVEKFSRNKIAKEFWNLLIQHK
jgi:glycosyltransferase involved in cell wall biosynthesis